MNRIIIALSLTLLAPMMQAQIPPSLSEDPTWELKFVDDFTTFERWNSVTWYSETSPQWRATMDNGITHGTNEAQLYQYTHCVYDSANGTMRLESEYDWEGRIPRQEYSLPNSMTNYPNNYGSNSPSNSNEAYYFFSGAMEFKKIRFHYGYFEIRCKLPLHNGSFPAFWLIGSGGQNYEEIDIFEYSHVDCDDDFYRGFSAGIWHNPNDPIYSYGDSLGAENCLKVHHHLDSTGADLSSYHIFGCEWMPDYVRWYIDGELWYEYTDTAHIPRHPKIIKVNYALHNSKALNNDNEPNNWSGSDAMVIDYVKVYQPRSDCDKDEHLTSNQDLLFFDNKMKRSITIGSSNDTISIPEGTHMFMHATEHITIDKNFVIPLGSSLTLTIHQCPECNNVMLNSSCKCNSIKFFVS